MSRPSMAAALAATLAMPLAASAGSDQADVALVLAIDVSGSVDDSRFALQRRGIAVVEWAEEQRVLVPWTVIRGRDDLETLATRLRSTGRSWVHTMTDPGGGIAAAERLFAEVPLAGMRQIIDVSGDGRQNTGEVATAEARDAAVLHGLTVNGLPIACAEEPGIEDWYRTNVIGGPGAFLVVANGYAAFAEAFRQKLTLEVAGLALDPTKRDRRSRESGNPGQAACSRPGPPLPRG